MVSAPRAARAHTNRLLRTRGCVLPHVASSDPLIPVDPQAVAIEVYYLIAVAVFAAGIWGQLRNFYVCVHTFQVMSSTTQ